MKAKYLIQSGHLDKFYAGITCFSQLYGPKPPCTGLSRQKSIQSLMGISKGGEDLSFSVLVVKDCQSVFRKINHKP